jgi:hypothetical protein
MKLPSRVAFTLAIACVGGGHLAHAAESDAAFRARATSLYDFEPHKLSQQEMESKSAELDRFWDSIKANPQATLPLLRQLLRDPSQSAFFYYDGSKLLLSLSEASDDLALVARSIPRADLRGIDSADYLRITHWLASKGQDTREAAFRILAYPEFTAFIPQHALTLGQDYSLIYMLFPMEEGTFVDDLVRRLASEAAPKSQRSILLALWYSGTPGARDALIRYAAGSGEVRAYAAQLLARKPASGGGSSSSLQQLRDERRSVMSRPISDEALIEFDRLTASIMAKQ